MLQVKRLHPDARLPERKTALAVGYDLYSCEDCAVLARSHRAVNTGVAVHLPEGCYGRVAARSSLAVDSALFVGAGVIDPDYTGAIKVVLFNHSDNTFVVNKGERIGQLILEQCKVVPVEEITGDLPATERGDKGFGSTNEQPQDGKRAKTWHNE